VIDESCAPLNYCKSKRELFELISQTEVTRDALLFLATEIWRCVLLQLKNPCDGQVFALHEFFLYMEGNFLGAAKYCLPRLLIPFEAPALSDDEAGVANRLRNWKGFHHRLRQAL
jgi:hypothetical protein